MIRYFIVLILLTSELSAETLIECGPSKGYSYYFPNKVLAPNIPSREYDWEEDAFSNSSISLIKTPNGFDIDDTSNGKGRLFTSFGANVKLLSAGEVGFIIGVFHPEYVNTYYFNLISNQLTWTRQNNSPYRALSGAFVSDCEIKQQDLTLR